MFYSRRSDNSIHLIWSSSLGCHWDSTPRPLWIIVGVLVNSLVVIIKRKEIANVRIDFQIPCEEDDVVVDISNYASIFTRITLLPNACSNKILLAKQLLMKECAMRLFLRSWSLQDWSRVVIKTSSSICGSTVVRIEVVITVVITAVDLHSYAIANVNEQVICSICIKSFASKLSK